MFRSNVSPLVFEETKMPVAGLGAVIQSSELHVLVSTFDHLKRDYGELQQLREAVAEAERTYLNRRRRSRPKPLS